jgi:multisubunit Na+/H+ antiporter MnhG subunit
MTVFGKKPSEYVAFQKVFLVLIVAVGILRLVLSLAGVSDATTRWLSMTVVALVGMVYYAITVHTKGFGSYRQLLPLLVIQSVVANLIAIARSRSNSRTDGALRFEPHMTTSTGFELRASALPTVEPLRWSAIATHPKRARRSSRRLRQESPGRTSSPFWNG